MVNRKYGNGINWDIRTGKETTENDEPYTRTDANAWFDSRGKYLGYYSEVFKEFWDEDFFK